MTESSVEPRNRLAVVSLVLGIVAVVLSIVIIGGVLGLVSLVLGIIAMNRPARRGMAVAGIATGAVAILMSVVVALLALLLMPALSKSRAAADDVRTLANLRQLDLGLVMYTNDNRGLFPPGIAYVGHYVANGSVLQDPRIHSQPVSLPAGNSWVSDSAEVESHFDFIYTGSGLRLPQLRNPSTCIVIYDKPVAGHQRLIAFADGHAERMPPGSAQLARAVQSTNRARESFNLPPLPADLSGPP